MFYKSSRYLITVILFRKMPYYAVARGRNVGIFPTWGDCEKQVKGFPGAVYKKFSTQSEAEKFNEEKGGITATSKPNTEIEQKVECFPLGNKRKLEITKPTVIVAGLKVSARLKEYKTLKFLEDNDNFVHVYTDGSCENNGKPSACAGLGIYFGEGHSLNTSKPVSGRPTNNCGEIQAATMAINLTKPFGIKKLIIHTDSQFLINAVEKWISGWKKRGWKLTNGTPVKNKEDFVLLDEAIAKSGMEIKLV